MEYILSRMPKTWPSEPLVWYVDVFSCLFFCPTVWRVRWEWIWKSDISALLSCASCFIKTVFDSDLSVGGWKKPFMIKILFYYIWIVKTWSPEDVSLSLWDEAVFCLSKIWCQGRKHILQTACGWLWFFEAFPTLSLSTSENSLTQSPSATFCLFCPRGLSLTCPQQVDHISGILHSFVQCSQGETLTLSW